MSVFIKSQFHKNRKSYVLVKLCNSSHVCIHKVTISQECKNYILVKYIETLLYIQYKCIVVRYVIMSSHGRKD